MHFNIIFYLFYVQYFIDLIFTVFIYLFIVFHNQLWRLVNILMTNLDNYYYYYVICIMLTRWANLAKSEVFKANLANNLATY